MLLVSGGYKQAGGRKILRNYKLIIRYDGTRYKGWEHQPGTDMTIQGKMELAVIRMLNPSGKASFQEGAGNAETDDADSDFADGKSLQAAGQDCAAGRNCLGSFEGDIPEIISAGRTDGGVHALGMCANVHLDTGLNCTQIRDGLNRNLPDDICVISAEIVPDRFHARYNATGKTYRYTCYAGELKPVFDRRYCYELGSVPDIGEMRRAAGYIIGEHDFRSFCSIYTQSLTTVRTITGIGVTASAEAMPREIVITVTGTGFLYNMVRIIAGTLMEVGRGAIAPERIPEIIGAMDRRAAGPTAPPQGLTLAGYRFIGGIPDPSAVELSEA